MDPEPIPPDPPIESIYRIMIEIPEINTINGVEYHASTEANIVKYENDSNVVGITFGEPFSPGTEFAWQLPITTTVSLNSFSKSIRLICSYNDEESEVILNSSGKQPYQALPELGESSNVDFDIVYHITSRYPSTDENKIYIIPPTCTLSTAGNVYYLLQHLFGYQDVELRYYDEFMNEIDIRIVYQYINNTLTINSVSSEEISPDTCLSIVSYQGMNYYEMNAPIEVIFSNPPFNDPIIEFMI